MIGRYRVTTDIYIKSILLYCYKDIIDLLSITRYQNVWTKKGDVSIRCKHKANTHVNFFLVLNFYILCKNSFWLSMSNWLFQQLCLKVKLVNCTHRHTFTHKNELLHSNIKMFHFTQCRSTWTLLILHWHGLREESWTNHSRSPPMNWTRSCV